VDWSSQDSFLPFRSDRDRHGCRSFGGASVREAGKASVIRPMAVLDKPPKLRPT
jgi:hypothetical protein